MSMKKFIVGGIYATRSICDHGCVLRYIIVGRTACTVTAMDKHGETKKYRISKKLSELCGAEAFSPWGSYSMAPIVSADDIGGHR